MKKLVPISALTIACVLAIFAFRTPFRAASVTSAPEAEFDTVTATEATTRGRSSPRALPSPELAPRARHIDEAATPSAVRPLSFQADGGTVSASLPTLRAPIIDAIRSDKLRGEEKRRAMLAAIVGSGQSDEPWTEGADEAFDTWSAAMPAALHTNLSIASPRCYAAGCVADVTFADEESYRAASKAFRSVTERGNGHGGRVQTPPERHGDRVLASWIMLRPEGT